MCVDRRKLSGIKRYELGFRLTIDWCVCVIMFAILLLIYFSSANPIAYQNATGSENYIAGGSGMYNALSDVHLKSKNKKYIYSEKLRIASETEKNKTSAPAFNITEKLESNNEVTTLLNLEQTTVSDGLESSTENENYSTLTSIEVANLTERFDIEQGLELTTEYSNFVTTPTLDEQTTYVSEGLEQTTTETDEYVPTLTNAIDNLTESYDSVEGVELYNYTTTETNDETTITEFTTEYYKTTTNVLVGSNTTKNENTTVKADKNNTTRVCRDCDSGYKKSSKKVIETTTQNDYNLSYEDYEDEIVKAFSLSTTSTTTERSNPFNSLRNLANTFMESLYETYVPKTIRNVFKRMQEQNDRLEMVRLRSREENGGLGQFGRSIIKGLSAPLNQLMQGARDYGSLDSDKSFFAGVASDIVSLADSVSDAFKDRVRAIYPGTLWCGDGDMARSAEVGLFFMTDNCCKRHDACKYYIPAGATKYGLMNTGLFTRSHCECDRAFYKCLKRTNSFISMQIGVTYFSILGPQCFKHEHPIVKCMKKASGMTGSKCEEYQLDHSQPKMWQWFDNETF